MVRALGRLTSKLPLRQDVLLVAILVLTIAMMILPMPTLFADILIVLSMSISLEGMSMLRLYLNFQISMFRSVQHFPRFHWTKLELQDGVIESLCVHRFAIHRHCCLTKLNDWQFADVIQAYVMIMKDDILYKRNQWLNKICKNAFVIYIYRVKENLIIRYKSIKKR